MTDIRDLLADGSTAATEFVFLAGKSERIALTAAELWQRSIAVAAELTRRTPSSSTVAVVLTNQWESLAVAVGSLLAGRRLLSIPLPGRGMSPGVYRDQVDAALRVGDAGLLLVDERLVPVATGLPAVDATPLQAVTQDLRSHAGVLDRLNQGDAEFVQFSSGTTGSPRGVRLSMSALGAHVKSLLSFLELRDQETLCTWLPYSHDMGLIGTALTAWSAGHDHRARRTVVTLRPEDFIRSPQRWLEVCTEYGATITASPAFALELASRVLPNRQLDLSSLRLWIVGSDLIRPDVLDRGASRLAPYGLSAASLSPAYGMSEATLAVTMVPPGEFYKVVTDSDGKRWVSCGTPLPGVKVRLDDGDSDAQIVIASDGLFSGYLGAEHKSIGPWYRTDDTGFIESNELVVTGRSDDIVSIAGRKLSLTEIEATIQRFEGVRPGTVAAVVVDDTLALVIEPTKEGLGVRTADLRREIRASFGIAPEIVIVDRGLLPKTPSGKLRRTAAQQLASSALAGER